MFILRSRGFYDKRMSQEVEGEILGDDFKVPLNVLFVLIYVASGLRVQDLRR